MSPRPARRPPAAATRRAIARRSPSVAMRARRATRLPQRVAVRIDHPHLAQAKRADAGLDLRSEEHTSELQSLMRSSYAVFCLTKTTTNTISQTTIPTQRQHYN